MKKPTLSTDLRIIAITSAVLRLENVLETNAITDPTLTGQIAAMAQRLRREVSLIRLNTQTPAV